MKTLGKVIVTDRGFELIEFEDRYNQKCSLQQSSLADYAHPGTSAIWLGVDTDLNGIEVNCRMHLDLKQAKLLIKSLQRWVKTGNFKTK